MAEGLRSSGRKRKVPAKYITDPFEGLEISNDSDRTAASSDKVSEDVAEDEDAEFRLGRANGDMEVEDDDQSAEDVSEDDASAQMEQSEDDEHTGSGIGSGVPGAEKATEGKRRRLRKHPGRRSQNPVYSRKTGDIAEVKPATFERDRTGKITRLLHARGLGNLDKHAAKNVRMMSFFGTGKECLDPIARACDKWFNEITLPSHSASQNGVGGLGYSFFCTEDLRNREVTIGWDWYHRKGGQEALAARQRLRMIDAERGHQYLVKVTNPRHSFLLGPLEQQKLITLSVGESSKVADGFDGGQQENSFTSVNPRAEHRSGWIVNLGAKVHCLEWLPGQEDRIQYLAVSLLPKESQRSPGTAIAPAFTPSSPSTASIQIWSIFASSESHQTTATTSAKSPRLVAVLCANWSQAKQFKWCPMRKPPQESSVSSNSMQLGLLAGIWGDGKLRVLDVSIPKSSTGGPRYIKFDAAALETSMPNTICTCLAWLSPDSIAVGTAAGTIACFSLAQIPKEPQESPRPWLYTNHHTSYILSLTTGWPSRPYLLFSTSVTGYLRLMDLRSPLHGDTVLSQRSRMGTSILMWSDVLQAALTSDENYGLRALPARRFYSSVHVARYASNVLSIATSPVHPFVLAGTADGRVSATNPLRKYIEHKTTAFQQTTFSHEWSRLRKPEGISRFVEGWKVETSSVGPSSGLGNKKVTGKGVQDIMFSTLFEEESGVTQIAWNPNLAFGTWAAAGTGCGLLRVEDLGIQRHM